MGYCVLFKAFDSYIVYNGPATLHPFEMPKTTREQEGYKAKELVESVTMRSFKRNRRGHGAQTDVVGASLPNEQDLIQYAHH